MGLLLERILLVVLVTLLVGLAFLLLFLANLQVPRETLRYALLTVIGVAAGFSARRLLTGRSALLRFVASLFALTVTLLVLTQASQGYLGLDVLHQFPGTPAWEGAVGLLVSAAAAWLALHAFPLTRSEIIVEPRQPSLATPAPRPSQRSATGRVRTARRSPPPAFVATFNAWRHRVNDRLAAILPGPRISTPARPKTRKPTKTKRFTTRATRRASGVHFSGAEEHMCPYCLEPVFKNDPRGVKICKVCKTWHHADCWAITGVCQVPHQYVN